MFDYLSVIDLVGKVIDSIGVLVIVTGSVYALLNYILTIFSDEQKNTYRILRDHLGRTILLGLEFLIAGDIIRSIAVPPSFQSVSVLGIIVLIRTFLSIEFEHEISGVWPWKRKSK